MNREGIVNEEEIERRFRIQEAILARAGILEARIASLSRR